MGLQDQLLIVEKIISKALNLWSRASLIMLEFIKAKNKAVLGSSTRNLYSLIFFKKIQKWKKVVQMRMTKYLSSIKHND